ncbi:hypothetical protein [Sphingosinicella sp.]|jgi:hypothetical protein|uniref:hypothetical protein n=1 Tax=Sphingosinicella sp. TaxID=1917971 RepID=UPI0025FD9A8B|nr:hypothetical protein [Sphingosinicella sp.]MEA3540267.1 hypothetical protein [Pseudomonadota bacterium]
MVDNFALLVSQLMMIVVLWRCFTLPDEGDNMRSKAFGPKNRRQSAEVDKTPEA